MPIHFTIDPYRRLMTAVAEGDISQPEFAQFLDATTGNESETYRKLFDGRFASTHMSPEDVFAFGVRMKSRQGQVRAGPLAIVMQPHHYEMVSRVLGMLATADRPMSIFEELDSAQRWIESEPVRNWDAPE